MVTARHRRQGKKQYLYGLKWIAGEQDLELVQDYARDAVTAELPAVTTEIAPSSTQPVTSSMVVRSRVTAPDLEARDREVTAPEMTTVEAINLEVNGPLWDSHAVDAEPETHEEVVTR